MEWSGRKAESRRKCGILPPNGSLTADAGSGGDREGMHESKKERESE